MIDDWEEYWEYLFKYRDFNALSSPRLSAVVVTL